ncbi:putative terpene synthase 2, partial [Mucuna pruriens]
MFGWFISINYAPFSIKSKRCPFQLQHLLQPNMQYLISGDLVPVLLQAYREILSFNMLLMNLWHYFHIFVIKELKILLDGRQMDVSNNVKQQAQILKEEVKMMFQSSNHNIMEKLKFIDRVQRFNISYHFQKEINQALEHIHNVFNKFKNDRGNFNEILVNDVQGLCSLYEATHLRTHEDNILEEACDFSNTQLISLANQVSLSLSAQINHCLRQSFNKSVHKFETRYHMTIYEQDPFHNETLLTFVKVDFNIKP